ncbi:copper resistance CopC family protein [Georgenia yuyongxinii]|nr:copper resistance CopC family protein [Georgenia yuyongxinii]
MVLAMVGLAVLGAAPAAAHSQLTESTPSIGEVVETAPGQLDMTFSAGVVTADLEVTDGCGRPVPAQAAVDGQTVRGTFDLPDVDLAGDWIVRWSLIGEDGHELEGTVPFAVAGTPDCAAGAVTPVEAAEAPDQADTAAAAEAVEADTAADAVLAATGSADDGDDGTAAAAAPAGGLPVGVIVAGVIVLGAAAAAFVGTRRRAPPHTAGKRR